MKKLAVKDKGANCMACLTCENVCAGAFYKTENTQTQNLSCVHVIQDSGKLKVQVCLQCGKCAKTCEVEAITKNAKGVFTLDKNKCVDCGKCMEACPVQVMVKAQERKSPTKCIACGVCAKACPMDVLYVKEE
ncbi:MAG: 4Fe-4S binding protein [Treponema sp.]|nr:4Fe-4S binding protein [Treponema sp.]